MVVITVCFYLTLYITKSNVKYIHKWVFIQSVPHILVTDFNVELILSSLFPCLQHQEPNELINSVRTNYINLSGMAMYTYDMINCDMHVTINLDKYNNSELLED